MGVSDITVTRLYEDAWSWPSTTYVSTYLTTIIAPSGTNTGTMTVTNTLYTPATTVDSTSVTWAAAVPATVQTKILDVAFDVLNGGSSVGSVIGETNLGVSPATPTTPIPPETPATSTTPVTPVTSGSPTQNTAPTTSVSSATGTSSTAVSTGTSTSLTQPSSAGASQTPVVIHRGLSDGAAAGVGIGCAVIGAIIAAVLVWCLMRRRKRYHPARTLSEHDASRADYSPPLSKQPDMTMTPLDQPAAVALISSKIPQPLPEQNIATEMSKLGTSVKNHVQSYYVNGGAEAPTAKEGANTSRINRLIGEGAPVPSDIFEYLISIPGSRIAALRFLISFAILQRLEFSSAPETTLLPPEVAMCLESMSGMSEDPKARMAFFSMWRAVSAAMMQPTYKGEILAHDPRNHNIAELVRSLDAILNPYASPRLEREDRLKNLEEIIKRAARFGYTLFSQPTTWQFEWEDSRGSQRGELVVFPALVQVGDDEGRRMSRPKTFTERDVVFGIS